MTAEKIGNPGPEQRPGNDGTFDQKWSITTGSSWFLKVTNTHILPVLLHVAKNQGTTILETKDALYTTRGNAKHLEIRREIANAFDILLLLGLFEKHGHRFYTTPKADRIIVAPESRVPLRSDGLPIARSFKSQFRIEDTHIPIGPRITRDEI